MEAICAERVTAPKRTAAGMLVAPSASIEKLELGRLTELAEHLPYGELVVEEKALAERAREYDGRRGDADGASATDEVDLALLGNGSLGACSTGTWAGVRVDRLDGDRLGEECAVKEEKKGTGPRQCAS